MMKQLLKNTKKEKEKTTSKGKIPLFQRLTFRMPLRVSLLTLAIFLILGLTTSLSVSRIVKQDTEKSILYLAEENARVAGEYLNTMQVRAHSLSTMVAALNHLAIERSEKEKLIKEMMKRVLEDDRIFSVYTAWEPDAFYADTPNGQSFYYYRDLGMLTLDEFNDYDVYKDGDYYAVARDTKEPYMTEPYAYMLTNGKEVWLITISNPIFDDHGKFLGVANTDIVMDTIGALQYNNGDYKTSYSYLLSNEGYYLAHSDDQNLLGKSLLEGKSGNGLAVAENVIVMTKNATSKVSHATSLVTGKMSYIMQVPLVIEGIDKPLSSTFVVSEREALQDMYNVIYSILGLSVVGLAILIVSVMLYMRKSLRPLDSVVHLADSIKAGNLQESILVTTKDEFGHLASTFSETSVVLRSYINEIAHTLSTLARGDLQISIQNEYHGDFAPIKQSLLQIISSLNTAFSKIGMAADLVNAGASQISSSSQALASGATEQAATLEELNASIATVSDQARDNASNVQRAADLVHKTKADVNSSNAKMEQLNRSMIHIGDSSKQIAGITKLVEDIAFQTNILALNAAVEAARAGTAGKGFAVVADEVRSLASKSSEAAKRTEELVRQSNLMIQDGIQATEQTTQILQKVVEQTQHINDVIAQIEQASVVQANAIYEITQGLNQVSDVVQTNAATAEEGSASSAEMSNQASVLWEEVQKFKL